MCSRKAEPAPRHADRDQDWLDAGGTGDDLTLSFDDELLETEEAPPVTLSAETTEARYEIVEHIGRGGQADVYKAIDRRLGRVVALKRIRPDRPQTRRAVQRFVQEARAIARLNHFNIVQVYDIGQDDDGLFIAMEYIEGESLGVKLRRDGAQSLRYALDLGRQLCRALDIAHSQGVIHRDVKPRNILLSKDGVPKLVDFGLASTGNSEDGTAEGAGLGTLYYAAPEQFASARGVDARADVFAVGATLYEVITGQSPSQVRESLLPDAVRPVLLKALARDREDRYAAVDELEQALRNIALAQAATEATNTTALQVIRCARCGHENPGAVEFCGSCGFALSQVRSIAALLESAREQARRNNLDDALHQYQTVLTIDPQNETARDAAADVRRRLDRIATLRERANLRAAAGQLQHAVKTWQSVLELLPGDTEAKAQIRKCVDQIRARKVEQIIAAARENIAQFAFAAARDKCEQVLKIDRQSQEAIALLKFIKRARQPWLKNLIRAGVQAYRQQKYESAYERFFNAYHEAKHFAAQSDVQKIQEGMEMSRLAPALREIYNLVAAQSFVAAFAQLDQLDQRHGSRRAKQILARARRYVDKHFARKVEQEKQEADLAARARRRKRRRRLLTAGASVVVLVLLVLGGMALQQRGARAALADEIRTAHQAGDLNATLAKLERFTDLGGNYGAVASVCDDLRDKQLGAWLRANRVAEAKYCAGILARLGTGGEPGAILFGVAEDSFTENYRAQRWPAVFASLGLMATHRPASVDDEQVARRVRAVLDSFVETPADISKGAPHWESLQASLDESFASDRPLWHLLRPEDHQRLMLARLRLALLAGDGGRCKVLRQQVDKDDASQPGTALVTAHAEGIINEVRARCQTAEDIPKGEQALETCARLVEDRAVMRPGWAWLTDKALEHERWEEAWRFAAKMDEGLEGDERPGGARIANACAALKEAAREDLDERAYDQARAKLRAILCLANNNLCRAAESTIHTYMYQIGRRNHWSDGRDLVVELEEAAPGCAAARLAFERLFIQARGERKTDVIRELVVELKSSSASRRNAERYLDDNLGALLDDACKTMEHGEDWARANVVDTLIELVPLLEIANHRGRRFCSQQRSKLSEELSEAYELADGEAARERIKKLARLLGVGVRT